MIWRRLVSIFRKSEPDKAKIQLNARLEQAKQKLDDKTRIKALGYEAAVRARQDLEAKGHE